MVRVEGQQDGGFRAALPALGRVWVSEGLPGTDAVDVSAPLRFGPLPRLGVVHKRSFVLYDAEDRRDSSGPASEGAREGCSSQDSNVEQIVPLTRVLGKSFRIVNLKWFFHPATSELPAVI